jgi:hypothetical protein
MARWFSRVDIYQVRVKILLSAPAVESEQDAAKHRAACSLYLELPATLARPDD